ncbi:MAG: hypothetical protein H6625_12270 [Bdellovibrionaceae bacterium]|nr:hypothetical protein [Pseudobdellovibrionaceae bacterium]
MTTSWAIAPSKATVCSLALQNIVSSEYTSQTATLPYTLNSLEAFLQHILKVNETIEPGTPEGFFAFYENASHGAKNEVAGSRVQGIIDFSSQQLNEDTNQLQFTKTIIIDGKEDIAEFIELFNKRYLDVATQDSSSVLKIFKNQIIISLLLTGSIYSERLINGLFLQPDPLVLAGSSALFGFYIMFGMDHFLYRQFKKDWKINKDLKKLLALVNSETEEYSVLLSRNSMVYKPLLDNALQSHLSDETLQFQINNQSLFESTPLISKILSPQKYQKIKNSMHWLGLDLFLTKSKGSSPELHIIVRGSKQNPSYPQKTSKEYKLNSPEQQARPQLQPSLIPIRIK